MKLSKLVMILATVAVSMSLLIASAKVQVEHHVKAANTLYGSVVDASSYEGITGAEVTVVGTEISTTTDENGVFTIENLEEGTITVKVETEGYATAEKEVEITGGEASVQFILETEEQ